MVDSFHHLSLAVSDIPRAVSFYQEVLGIDPVGPDDSDAEIETATYYWMTVSHDQWLMLAERPDATPTEPTATDDPHVAFRGDEETITAVERRLDDRDMEYRSVGTGVYFHDPDTNYIEVTDFAGPS